MEGGFPDGYSRVTSAGGLEFGLLRLEPGAEYRDSSALERVFLLLGGEADVQTMAGQPIPVTADLHCVSQKLWGLSVQEGISLLDVIIFVSRTP